MKFENTKVSNFEGAFRGMRNPLASWDKSDSVFEICKFDEMKDYETAYKWYRKLRPNSIVALDEERAEVDSIAYWLRKQGILQDYNSLEVVECALIGPNDMGLAQRLCKAGSEHRKFLRQIQVSVDITAPLYWWKEFDTYKVGTVANSTSTMHKLASTPITMECFETDDYDEDLDIDKVDQSEVTEAGKEIGFIAHWHMDMFTHYLMEHLEDLRVAYNTTKDKRYWKELVRWLPEGWLQTRTITMNYENIRAICRQREGHKLTEWHQFIDWIDTLPYAKQLIHDERVVF